MADNATALKNLRKELRGKYPEDMDVGDFTYGNLNVIQFGEGAKVHVGKFCSIAENVTVMLGGNHRTDWATTYPFNALLPKNYGDIKGHPSTNGDVWIGNDVWIGRDVKILSGVCIGDGAVLATGSIVTRDVYPYSMVAGVPARFVKNRFPVEYVSLLVEMKWWDWNLEHIAEAVPLLQSKDISKLYKYWKEWNYE